MKRNDVSRRQYNFRLLSLYGLLSVGIGLVNRWYSESVYKQMLAEGLTSKEVMESLGYNNSTGMIFVFLLWIWLIGVFVITYHEPKISDFIFKKLSPKANAEDSNSQSRE